MSNIIKIALYGGAFDPITLGHKKIIDHLLNRNIVDRVWLMPCYISASGKNMSNFEDRYNMCQIMATKCNYEYEYNKVIVSDFEKNYNVDGNVVNSTNKFMELYNKPDTQFYFVIGQDNADKIGILQNKNEIINLMPFIVVPRDSPTWIDSMISFWYTGLPNYLPWTKTDEEHLPWYKYCPHIYIEDYDKSNISSTAIRKGVKENTDVTRLIDNDVLHYVNEHHLYRKK